MKTGRWFSSAWLPRNGFIVQAYNSRLPGAKPSIQCAAVAALVTLLAAGWLCLTVQRNYGGHWNALFMTGGNFGAPAGVEFQDTYVFAGSYGYDGQFYRVIAHDPWLQRGFYLDSPRLRYRRILVPALAYAFALGRGRLIDAA